MAIEAMHSGDYEQVSVVLFYITQTTKHICNGVHYLLIDSVLKTLHIRKRNLSLNHDIENNHKEQYLKIT